MHGLFKALILSTTLMLSATAWATETPTPETGDDSTIETNAFGYPENNVVAVIETANSEQNTETLLKPDCQDRLLIEQTQNYLRSYFMDASPNIADRRQNKLALKNIDNFTELSQDDVNINTHRVVAARLVELKINQHVKDAQIKICQSNNPILQSRVYLVMYDENNQVRVEIVNLHKGQNPSFLFEVK
jgi:hypothetical protein